ncbi:hypothetical protein JOC77_000852 [Peribacillus deserti]|uniref:Uncharacterized protein n=1 Tax=Peribacillus deserti TaxID=673318 RepID=A0ABS2QE49_9BACI|nr:hypothetical protein [Peribacillus deserti]MBM7691447.1 hypothetical protein [Peribacillus deserti]
MYQKISSLRFHLVHTYPGASSFSSVLYVKCRMYAYSTFNRIIYLDQLDFYVDKQKLCVANLLIYVASSASYVAVIIFMWLHTRKRPDSL